MGIQGEDWVDSGCVNKGVSSLLIFEQQIVDLLHVGLLDLAAAEFGSLSRDLC
jgi:hypothetical protein